jgi:hypothetical protein
MVSTRASRSGFDLTRIMNYLVGSSMVDFKT